jgi:hypothetical protein
MNYGFHHNIPTEVRLVKATKAILVPAPEPVLYHRTTLAQRASGKVHVIETSTACAACASVGHQAACRFCAKRKS